MTPQMPDNPFSPELLSSLRFAANVAKSTGASQTVPYGRSCYFVVTPSGEVFEYRCEGGRWGYCKRKLDWRNR